MIDRRGLRQKAVAERVKLTESSLSNILNGHSRPRQVTLSRLIRELDATREEQQRILAAYDHTEAAGLSERPSNPEDPIPPDEIERVERYMETKSMAITFQEDVEKILRSSGHAFEHPHRQGALICDFLIMGPPRVALECKFNVNRDWDRTTASVDLLRKHLGLEAVLVVVPYENDASKDAETRVAQHGGRIVVVAEVAHTLNGLMTGKEAD